MRNYVVGATIVVVVVLSLACVGTLIQAYVISSADQRACMECGWTDSTTFFYLDHYDSFCMREVDETDQTRPLEWVQENACWVEEDIGR